MRPLLPAFLALILATASQAQIVARGQGALTVEPMLSGLDQPWAVDVLPEGDFLVTERGGDLLYVRDGEARKVAGVPRVRARGQGGLLDVTVARDFARSRALFLTFSKPQSGGANTAMVRARLSADGRRLTDVKTLFEAKPGVGTNRHYGSRVVEARDGTLFVTIGDRGERPKAQDPDTYHGTVVRVTRDGAVPADNPFVGKPGHRPEIWTYGHRNPQGAGLDLQGNLWTAEHGAKGGDEVNRIRKGANFGWPVISYGVHYNGRKIGEGTAKPGLQQPEHYWDPSIAPSGLLVYSGKLWPEWRGDIFVGSLKFDYISRLDGTPLREVEQLRGAETERVRDIVEAPDGAIWFISVGQGTVYRITPGR